MRQSKRVWWLIEENGKAGEREGGKDRKRDTFGWHCFHSMGSGSSDLSESSTSRDSESGRCPPRIGAGMPLPHISGQGCPSHVLANLRLNLIFNVTIDVFIEIDNAVGLNVVGCSGLGNPTPTRERQLLVGSLTLYRDLAHILNQISQAGEFVIKLDF